MKTITREARLERITKCLIDHLKSLPPDSRTAEMITTAEHVLRDDKPRLALEGIKSTSTGVEPIAARLLGNVLLLTSTDVSHLPPLMQQSHKDAIYKGLLEGYLLSMRPEISQPHHLFETKIGKQNLFHSYTAE